MELSSSTVKYLLLFCSLLIASFSCKQAIKYKNGAVPPGEVVKTFETEPAFKMELVATEPLIAGPVDLSKDIMTNVLYPAFLSLSAFMLGKYN